MDKLYSPTKQMRSAAVVSMALCIRFASILDHQIRSALVLLFGVLAVFANATEGTTSSKN